MITLRVCGPVDLLDGEGQPIAAVLTQPKRLALLAYLAVAAPGGYVRRDTLLALFWPESDAERGRGALNRAIYYLRKALGDGTVVSRGDGELGVDTERIWCDAVAARAAFAEERPEEALELLKGELLAGIFVPQAAEFERWLELERAGLRGQATAAAAALSAGAAGRDRLSEATAWARRAASLSPYDEAVHRRLLELLERQGDGTAALLEHESFASRLTRDLDCAPSPETESLVARIRSRGSTRALLSPPPPQAAAAGPPVVAPPLAASSAPPLAASSAPPKRHRRRVLWRIAAAAALLGALGLASRGVWGRRLHPYEPAPAAQVAFARGQAAYQAGRFTDAVSALQRAIGEDSTFALAELRLSQAMIWTGQTIEAQQAAGRARAMADRLTPDDRRVLALWTAFLDSRVATAESLYAALPTGTQRRTDVQSILGEIRFHWGPAFGRSRAEALGVLRDLTARHPTHTPALIHLLRLAAQLEAADSVDAIAQRVLEQRPSLYEALEARGLAAWRRGDQAGLEALVSEASRYPVYERRLWLTTLAATGHDPVRLVPVTRRLIGTADDAFSRVAARVLAVYLLAAAGRLEDAAREADALEPLAASTAAEMRAVVATLPFRSADPERLARTMTDLRRFRVAQHSNDARLAGSGARFARAIHEPRRLFLLGLADVLAGGDSISTAAIEQLDGGVEGADGRWLARLLRGSKALLVSGRHEEAVDAMGLPFDVVGSYPELWHYPLAVERYLRAEALRGSRGWHARALRWYATFPDAGAYDLAFLAPAHLRQAEVLEQMGEGATAAAHYARVLELWRNADPELRPWLEEARRGWERTRRPASRVTAGRIDP